MLVLLILIPSSPRRPSCSARRRGGRPAARRRSTCCLRLWRSLVTIRLKSGYQETFRFDILPEWHLQFFLGVDGLSLVMLLLTAIVTVAALWVAPEVKGNERAYFASLLFISAGATGAFASLDLFFFYAFHELALIPTFLLIGIWGTGRPAGGRLEDHHLSRGGQLHPAARASGALPQLPRRSPHV